jgi:16S rRNA (guanine527-N7)-methyltransferase
VARATFCVSVSFGQTHYVRNEFVIALVENQTAFGIELTPDALERLADYYELVEQHNPLLHLTGPATPEQFAVRHILESLTMLEHVPMGETFTDLGAGAGLPSIPCLIVREDLQCVLIESKDKKAEFLRLATEKFAMQDRTIVVSKQFSETQCPPGVSYVACRAIDKFTTKLSQIVKWSGSRRMLFFAGPSLLTEMKKHRLVILEEKLMPMSEQRYLYVVKRN